MVEQHGVYVLGAGGHAKVVVSTLRAADFKIQGILDDDELANGRELLGVPIVGSIAELERIDNPRAVIAIGNNRTRQEIAGRFPAVEWITAVHPSAVVDPSVVLGPGTVIFAGAIIQPDTAIGRHVIVNTGATIDHDCGIGDYTHIAPGCNLAGQVEVGEGVLMGIGSAAVPLAKIGAWTTVGAGGVVIQDLPANIIAAGIPAKPIKS